MNRRFYVRLVTSVFLFFLTLGISATFYNSIVLGNFDSFGVTFHESEGTATEVVFFYEGALYKFETTSSELDEQFQDLRNQLGDIFDTEFYTMYTEFFTEYYSES